MDVVKYYKVLIKYRRLTAGVLATGLALNKGLSYVFPVSLCMTRFASLDADRFPFDHVVWLLRTTKQDLGVKEDVLPFVSISGDCHGAGFFAFSKWKQPCVLGIPRSYFCSNIFEVEDLDIRIGSGEKGPTCEGGPNEKEFLESLVYSKAAQKFAAAKQIIAFKDNWAIWQTLLSPFFVILGYVACFHGSKLLFLFGKSASFLQIVGFQLVCILITCLLCKIANAALFSWMIKSTDRKAASISEEYAIGAVEYCQNLQNTNKALRNLYGKKGERMFTAFGNHKEGLLWNKNGPSLTQRENKFNIILKSFQSKASNDV